MRQCVLEQQKSGQSICDASEKLIDYPVTQMEHVTQTQFPSWHGEACSARVRSMWILPNAFLCKSSIQVNRRSHEVGITDTHTPLSMSSFVLYRDLIMISAKSFLAYFKSIYMAILCAATLVCDLMRSVTYILYVTLMWYDRALVARCTLSQSHVMR